MNLQYATVIAFNISDHYFYQFKNTIVIKMMIAK